MANEYRIVSGPSKMDLMLCLFDLPEIDGVVQRRAVRFRMCTVTDGAELPEMRVIIESVEREDGSYESWNFTGRVIAAGAVVHAPKIKGYYSTRLRKGACTFDY